MVEFHRFAGVLLERWLGPSYLGDFCQSLGLCLDSGRVVLARREVFFGDEVPQVFCHFRRGVLYVVGDFGAWSSQLDQGIEGELVVDRAFEFFAVRDALQPLQAACSVLYFFEL